MASGSGWLGIGRFALACTGIIALCVGAAVGIAHLDRPSLSASSHDDVSLEEASVALSDQTASMVEECENAERLINAQLERQDVDPAEIPAAFQKAREINGDACAWLYVPGTNISMAVLQRKGDDSYYLEHDIYGEYSPFGEPFIESVYSKEFDSSVTVIYGHSFSDADTVFTQLHRFEDEDFFETHSKLRVYLADRTLTYRVVSASNYASAHLPAPDNLQDELLQSYLEFAMHPSSYGSNERETADPVAGRDRIVQLSTCTLPVNSTARYVVTGLLIKEEGNEQ